jgi:UDP-glucuronate 4-epimerase
MKVMITGMAGFIGFHTAIKFKELGHEVCGLDNYNGVVYEKDIKHDRAKKLWDDHKIAVSPTDLNNIATLDFFVKAETPDLVIHLAAHPGVRVSMDIPNDYIQNNIGGTQNLIKVCEDNGIDNVIYASTSCTMHGNPLPWSPDEKLGPQLSPYGYTKQTNENQFNISKIKNAVCLRFFTVYGPWGRPDMALYTFTNNILEDKPIEVYNDGNMIRDFTYVEDIVQGIEIVSRNMSDRETYCIGNGKQVQLMDFIDHIEKNLGKTAEKVYKPKHPADALETWSDTTKLQALGYEAKTPIAEGVKHFIQWHRNYYGRNIQKNNQ